MEFWILIMGRAGGPSGMMAEHLKVWIKEASKGKGTRHKTLGKTGECDEVGVPKGPHPGGTGMEEYGSNS